MYSDFWKDIFLKKNCCLCSLFREDIVTEHYHRRTRHVSSTCKNCLVIRSTCLTTRNLVVLVNLHLPTLSICMSTRSIRMSTCSTRSAIYQSVGLFINEPKILLKHFSKNISIEIQAWSKYVLY